MTDPTPMWRRYLRFFRPDPAADATDELEFHLDMRTRDLMARGLAESDARRQAERELGDTRRYSREMRDIGRVRERRVNRRRTREEFAQDMRLALRGLRRNPGLSAIAALTLALGIGASTAMFTVVNAVLLRPLTHADPDRLVMIWERPPDDPAFDNFISPVNFFAWRERTSTLAAIAGYVDRPMNVTGAGEPDEVPGRHTTANYFTVLGGIPLRGALYAEGDADLNVAVLSHAFWHRHFAGDSSVVGRTIVTNGASLRIVAILREDFRPVGGVMPELWRPARIDPTSTGRFLKAFARLKPGVTIEQADADIRAIADRIASEGTRTDAGWSADVVPLLDQETGDVRRVLYVLLGAVGLLLLIACANVANLLLVRASARRKEMAVRLSLGATRARLVRQTMTEALVLGAVAGAAGLALGAWGTALLVRALPAELALPRLAEVTPDARVLVFGVLLTTLTCAVFGAAPALAGSAVRVADALRDAARGSTALDGRLRRGLVVAEVALAVVLLSGAALIARSVVNLMNTDPGIRTERVLVMRMLLAGYGGPDGLRAFVNGVLERFGALPGADAAGAIAWLPFSGSKSSTYYSVVGRPEASDDAAADIRIIAGEYHRTLGVPVLRGRTFDMRDGADAPRTFVVNQAFVDEQFPAEDPIGRRLSIPWDDVLEGEIIGVVGNVHESGLDEPSAPAIYWAYDQMPSTLMSFVVRTTGDPLALAGAVVAAVRDVNPNQPVAAIRTMDEVVRNTVALPRVILAVLGAFASASLLLAALGLVGVLSYSVAQRRREIGVRMALGAQPSDVRRLVTREGLVLTLIGLALGLAVSVGVTRVLASLLYEVRPVDPASLAAVAAFLVGVGLLASYVPARRASRVDPLSSLRTE